MAENQYTEENIRSLDWKEHIRLRPGMYIGKLGDGASADDGIYILVKEIVDNSIDEFVMGNGKRIDVKVKDGKVTVRDFGRGIPLGKVIDCVSQINTGGKYDSKTRKSDSTPHRYYAQKCRCVSMSQQRLDASCRRRTRLFHQNARTLRR